MNFQNSIFKCKSYDRMIYIYIRYDIASITKLCAIVIVVCRVGTYTCVSFFIVMAKTFVTRARLQFYTWNFRLFTNLVITSSVQLYLTNSCNYYSL